MGIKLINFVIHPTISFNLPLDIVFKLIHASKTVPFIKFNPGKRREQIFRLYTDRVATNGKKIPILYTEYGNKKNKIKRSEFDHIPACTE